MIAHPTKLRYALAAFLATAALASGRPASAGFIASDLGPGGSFDANTGYTLSGPAASGGIGYGLAVKFKNSGTSSVVFGSAQLALQFHTGANALKVLLVADSAGLPGATLETISFSNIATGPSLVTATSTVGTLLAPGTTFWLAAVASNDTFMTWNANNQGQMNDLAYRVDHGSGPQPWQFAAGNPDVAFSISTLSVPAPPSLVLLGSGLATLGFSLVGRGRRRA